MRPPAFRGANRGAAARPGRRGRLARTALATLAALAACAGAGAWAGGGVAPGAGAPGGVVDGPVAGRSVDLVRPGARGGDKGGDNGGPVVLIGMTGVGWDDVSAASTPAIWSLMDRGGGAAGMANRSVRVGSCPAEGWLAVGAGRRTGEVKRTQVSDVQRVDQSKCRELASPVNGRIRDWEDLTAAAAPDGEGGAAGPELVGGLARWLEEARLRAAAVGPGAALALADPDGRVVGAYREASPESESLAEAVSASLAEGADLLVVDVGVRSVDLVPSGLDARVGSVLAALEAAGGEAASEVILASLADWTSPALGVALAWSATWASGVDGGTGSGASRGVEDRASGGAAGGGPGPARVAPYLIESASTKTAGLVLTPDLTKVIKALLVPSPDGDAGPWFAGPGMADPEAVQERLADAASHAAAAREWAVPAWIVVVVVGALGIFGPLIFLAAVPANRPGAQRRRVVPHGLPRAAGARADATSPPSSVRLLRFGLPNQLVEFLALAAGAFPAAGLVANIVPWWRASAPLAIWAVAALGLALVVGLAAFAAGRAWRGGPDRSPSSESPSWRSGLVAPGAVGLFSALVVMMDPFIGRVFLRDAPLGFQTLLAVRLYGYPNTAFAVLVTGAILAVVLFAGVTGANGKRWITAGSVAAVGVVVLVLDAYPKWGADLGGAVAVVAAFMVLGLMAVGVRLNWKWVTAAAVAGLTAAAAVAWLDYRRGPEQWTHLGGFVDTLLAGGLWRVLEGKGMMWLRLSAGPVLGLALGAAVGVPLARHGAFAALKSEAWRRRPMLKPVMVALITAWVVGSLVNDSGLVVAIVGLGVAGPPVAAWLVLAQAQSQNQSQDRVSESEPEPGSGQDREAEPD